LATRALEPLLAAALGAPLLDANPEVQVHYMHDPVQDQLMLKRVTYFRLKRLRLGPAYERFLRESVAPGGTLLLDRQRSWPVTRVGERHLFQFRRRGWRDRAGAPPAHRADDHPPPLDGLARRGDQSRCWHSSAISSASASVIVR
jgi:hypothetical protein